MLAEIAIPSQAHLTLTYSVPHEAAAAIAPGSLVVVPLRHKMVVGVVVELTEKSNLPPSRLKEIAGIYQPDLSLSQRMLQLLKWLSDYYLCPLGEAIRSAMPPALVNATTMTLIPAEGEPGDPRLQNVLQIIRERGGVRLRGGRPQVKGVDNRSVRQLLAGGYLVLGSIGRPPQPKARTIIYIDGKPKTDAVGSALGLSAQRLISFLALHPDGVSVEQLRAAGFTRSVVDRLLRDGLARAEKQADEAIIQSKQPRPDPIQLTAEQKDALAAINAALSARRRATFLLVGVTGSGKTEIYIEATRHALSLGKSVLVLLPEIALTPQTVRRFAAALGCPIGVWHSRLSAGQRNDLYRKAKCQQVRIIIGVRSAVFAPLDNLGLIVIDEEQDDSYKQSDKSPRYNARDVALVRGQLESAVCVLGTATPSVESYYNARTGKYILLELRSRYAGRLPKPMLIDLRQATVERQMWPLSEPFIERICAHVSEGRQVILLLNRRGYAAVLMCSACGWVSLCQDCRVAMTYHRCQHQLRCHFCGRAEPAVGRCPNCEGVDFDYRGIGTQKLEELVVNLLGSKGVARLDSDTTARRGALETILFDFEQGHKAVLLGTKMVAKGHDFPRVGMVGVVLADAGLRLPDFRAAEKSFQLLTQAAGRAGRSSVAADAEFVVQTFDPTAPVFRLALDESYDGFYETELAQRREVGYPPFVRIIRVVACSEDDSLARWAASRCAREIRGRLLGGRVLGPAPTAVFRLGKKYHYQLLVKGKFTAGFKSWFKEFALDWHLRRGKEVQLKIDVDPREMI